MDWRLIALGFILVSSVVAIGAPSDAVSPDWVGRMAATLDRAPTLAANSPDWVDRMAAALDRAPALAANSPDWVDRMAAAMNRAPTLRAAVAALRAPEPEDWVGRMIAGHSSELRPQSVLEIEKITASLISACGAQNLDGVLALFARDATLTSAGRTYVGIAQIRDYWAHSEAFHPGSRWVGYSGGRTVRVGIDAQRATLIYEIVWLDAGTSKMVARSYEKDVLIKSGGAWTIAEMSSEVTDGI